MEAAAESARDTDAILSGAFNSNEPRCWREANPSQLRHQPRRPRRQKRRRDVAGGSVLVEAALRRAARAELHWPPCRCRRCDTARQQRQAVEKGVAMRVVMGAAV
eukprot:366068-Chlamydomonas_euryale.AAC.4